MVRGLTHLEMERTQNFGFVFGSGFLMTRVRLYWWVLILGRFVLAGFCFSPSLTTTSSRPIVCIHNTGINFLSHSASLAQNTLLMMSHSLIHLPPAHRSHPHHTFTVSFQAQNSPYPQIFSTIVCQHTPGLPSRTILDRTYSAQRFFIFSYFFFFFCFGRAVD